MFACCNAAPMPELIYFDLPGRGEAIRLSMTVAGMKFIDTRVQQEEWEHVKPTTPQGVVPVLKINGQTIAQSAAILSYIGSVGKLIPKDGKGFCKVMEVLAHIEDIFCSISADINDPSKPLSEEMMQAEKKRCEERLVTMIEGLEMMLKQSGANGFCWGKSLSVADIQVYVMASMIKSGAIPECPATVLDKKPCIVKIYEKVAKHPKIVAYYGPKDDKKGDTKKGDAKEEKAKIVVTPSEQAPTAAMLNQSSHSASAATSIIPDAYEGDTKA